MRSHPHRIMFITGALAHGGGERYILELAGHLKGSDCECYVCNVGRPASATHWFTDIGVRVIHVPMSTKWSVFQSHRLARIMRELKCDAVHCVGNVANLPGAVAGRIAGLPLVVATEHNPFSNVGTRLRAVVAGRLADGYIAVSRACQNALVRKAFVHPRDIRLIYYGVDLNRFRAVARTGRLRNFLGVSEGSAIIGTIGRLKPQKNYHRFLRVAKRIVAVRSDVSFVIVGEGPLETTLRESAVKMGLGRTVHFLGSRDDVHALLPEFDLFLLTSDREGFGIVLLEAQACGVSIVVTDSGGSTEAVESGVTALTATPDDEAGLAAACLRLLSEPETRSRMGEAGRRRVREVFDVKRMCRETFEAYLSFARR